MRVSGQVCANVGLRVTVGPFVFEGGLVAALSDVGYRPWPSLSTTPSAAECPNCLRLIYQSGNIFEGAWVEDQKHGSGKCYYLSTGKVYVGEWSSDVPKCGEYQDIVQEGEHDEEKQGGKSKE